MTSTVFYHPGKPGEVSHAAAAAHIAGLIGNPFTDGFIFYGIAYHAPAWIRRDRQRGRDLVPAGVMTSYLRAAAVREAFQGEGRS